jgi:hypothetical protein
VLLVVCVFLFRSMSGRIKKLPASFDPPAATTEPDPVARESDREQQ